MKKLILKISEYKLVLISVALLVTFSVGCVKKDEKEIKIGAILPLTGDAALYGDNIKKGIDLAIDQVNSKGGIKGRKVTVIFEDSKAVPTDGVSAFQKLVNIHKVAAVIGDAVSSVTLAIAPIAENNKIVILSPLSSAPALTDAGDFIFRNVPSDIYGGKVAAYFAAKEQGWKKLAVLFINNDFGVGLKKVFSRDAENFGSKIVCSEAYDQGTTDFRTQLLKIKSTDPDAIFLVGYREAAQILVQAKEMGLKKTFLGTGLLEDPNVIKTAKGAAEGLYFTQLQYDATSNDPLVKDFVGSFTRKYNSKPDIIAAYGYDAMLVLVFAIEKSNLTSEGIRDQMYKVKNVHGVTGDITFDKSGDVIQPMGIKTVKHGEFIWYKNKVSIE